MPLDCISRSRSSDVRKRDGDARAQRAMAASYFLVIDGLLPIGVGGDANFEPCTNLIRLLLFLSASPDDESKAEVDRFLLFLARNTGEALVLHFQADGAGLNMLLPGVQVVVHVDGTAPRLVPLRGVRSATR